MQAARYATPCSPLGGVSEALPIAQTALEHAKKSGDKQRIEFNYGYLANAQLAAGALDESLASFQQAEEMHSEWRARRLNSIPSGAIDMAICYWPGAKRTTPCAAGTINWTLPQRFLGQGMGLHNIGFAHLLIGRAQHELNQPEAENLA